MPLMLDHRKGWRFTYKVCNGTFVEKIIVARDLDEAIYMFHNDEWTKGYNIQSTDYLGHVIVSY